MINRWRLILGSFADDNLPLGKESQDLEETLSFLYDREYSNEYYSKESSKKSETGASNLTAPDWIKKVKKLFPKKTVEIMQNQALEKYNLLEMLTDEEVLKEMEPNIDLLRNIISFKDVLGENVKWLAYSIIRKVVGDISKKLEIEMKRVFYGKKIPNSTTSYKIFKNLDIKRTIRSNLKNYDINNKSIAVERLYFNQNIKKYNPWNIIILIDESGSMTDSVIYSSITASIFSKLPFISVKLIIFDTSLVDLSEYVQDAVDILMKVQLGGGTDVVKALEYAKSITVAPNKTIVILISDLYDGKDFNFMYRSAKDIIESGSKLFVLPALNYDANASYSKEAAKGMSKLGAEVAAITPEELSNWINKVIS